jgi:hypothetical protein
MAKASPPPLLQLVIEDNMSLGICAPMTSKLRENIPTCIDCKATVNLFVIILQWWCRDYIQVLERHGGTRYINTNAQYCNYVIGRITACWIRVWGGDRVSAVFIKKSTDRVNKNRTCMYMAPWPVSLYHFLCNAKPLMQEIKYCRK